MVFLATAGLISITFAESIIAMFTPGPEVFPLAVTGPRFFSYRYISYGYGMVAGQAFNGAGGTFTLTLLNLICFWLSQIPLAWFLAIVLKMGPKSAFLSVAIADTLLAGIGILWFRRGTRKDKTVQPVTETKVPLGVLQIIDENARLLSAPIEASGRAKSPV